MFSRTLLTGAAALVCVAGAAFAGEHPHTESKTVNVATYEVADGESVVKIIIKDGKPQIFLNGKEVASEQVETKNGLWRIKGADGETKARFFMRPSGEGGVNFRIGGDGGEADERVIELNRLIEGAGDAPRGVVTGRRGVLGVMLEEVDPATARQLKVDPEKSILVVGVAPESGAAEAGIKAHDIIVGIGEKPQGDLETIRAVLGEKKPGDEVKVYVLRGGEKERFAVRLKPAEGVEAPPVPEAFLREFEEASRWGRGANEEEDQARARVGVEREAPKADSDMRARVLRERERAVHERVEELKHRMHAEQDAVKERQHRIMRELKDQGELAKCLDGLREMRIEIDAETQKEIEEAMARAAEALEEIDVDIELPEIEFLRKGHGGDVLFFPEPPDAKAYGNVFRLRAPEAPRAPRAPMAPGGNAMFFSDHGGADRLARIEERLAKIEGILTGMAGGMSAKGGACNCDCCDD
ncbi:MAG: S1C family serine protease [Phycisphaerales bacterium]